MLDETPKQGPPGKAEHDAAIEAYQWQEQRRRPDGKFHIPVGGFGSGPVHFTLWLPSTRPDVRFKVVNGEPIRETLGDCFSDTPEIAAARDTVLKTFRSVNGVYTCDTAFLKYTIAVLRSNYTLGDDDLTMLLAGTKWHDPMMRHLLGGEDMVKALMGIRSMRQAPMPAPAPPRPVTAPPAPARHKSAIARATTAALKIIGLQPLN